MSEVAIDQDRAYEHAVRSAWQDSTMRTLVERAFLHEDVEAALAAFVRSEDCRRALRLLRNAGVKPGARVLDLGGGRGLLAAALALHGFETTLCEPNPSQVCGAGAAVRLSRALDPGFAIAADPVDALPPEAFDAVICRAVLHHVESLEAVLSSVRRVLVPGGAFIATDEPTVRHPGDVAAAQERHPFARYGVQEDAHPVAHYLGALAAVGFVDGRARFPVALRDYLGYVRPGVPRSIGIALYARYRLRSRLRPRPGQAVSLTTRRPLGGY